MPGDADVAPEVNNATPTDKQPQGILFWSTPESAAEGRITVLACVETLFAMSVTAYIAWRTRSLLFIAVPACVAPLLLLRTTYSTAIGITLFGRYQAWVASVSAWEDRVEESRRFVSVLSGIAFSVVVLSSSLAALASRIAAVGTAIWRHPRTTLGAIPGNWRRIALATDFHHPPEMVPGIEKGDVASEFRFADWFSFLREKVGERDPRLRWMTRVIEIPFNLIVAGGFLVLLFFPALLYRWSLKSTSVVYFPLLWAAFKSRRGGDTAAQRLETIATDQAERIVRWYAGFVLIVLTILPAVLAVSLQPIIAPVQSALGVEVVGFWVFTGEIKWWYAMRVVNAVITVGVFLFADKALRRIKYGRAHSDELVHVIIGTCLFVRGILGLVLVAKLFHVVVTAVDWSAVDWRIVPW